MSASMSDVSSQIRAALALTDPNLDTSVGTTTRKIIDAVSESIAESYLDQHMLAYTYDVDSKTGPDLDTFCQTIGGIARLAAKRASGTVTFSRGGSTAFAVIIPPGTQISSNGSPAVVVSTITSAVLQPGQSSVTVPVQAVVGGVASNVAANTLVTLLSVLDGVSAVSNMSPLTGGTDQETDAQLRARWKATAFRSMAGTESTYLGVALDHPQVTYAKVIGSSVTHFEQVQPTITNGVLSATSVAPDVAYAYPDSILVGGDITNGVLLVPGLDYTWNPGTLNTPPTITFNSTSAQYDTGDGTMAPVNGGVLGMQFRYVPTTSRNDPTGTRFSAAQGPAMMNKVDVYMSGQNPTSAIQTLGFTPQTFDVASGDPMDTANFTRLDGSNPLAGNLFLPLAFGPILQVPPVLTIGGSTYGLVGSSAGALATFPGAYRIVHEVPPKGYTSTSRFGLEFASSANYGTSTPAYVVPVAGSTFVIGNNGDYLYDSVPGDVQQSIDRWRLAGVDARAHAAQPIALRFSLAIMYDVGVSIASVNTSIDTAIASLLSTVGLGQSLQVSDVVQVVHAVPGVDNVRMLDGRDYSGWTYANANSYATGIQQLVSGQVAHSYITSGGYLTDAIFALNQAPTFASCSKSVRAQNTFLAS